MRFQFGPELSSNITQFAGTCKKDKQEKRKRERDKRERASVKVSPSYKLFSDTSYFIYLHIPSHFVHNQFMLLNSLQHLLIYWKLQKKNEKNVMELQFDNMNPYLPALFIHKLFCGMGRSLVQLLNYYQVPVYFFLCGWMFYSNMQLQSSY